MTNTITEAREEAEEFKIYLNSFMKEDANPNEFYRNGFYYINKNKHLNICE